MSNIPDIDIDRGPLGVGRYLNKLIPGKEYDKRTLRHMEITLDLMGLKTSSF